MTSQPGILAPVPAHARYLWFSARPGKEHLISLERLRAATDGNEVVVGIGHSLVAALGRTLPGLRDFPQRSGPGVEVPSTPAALWCWLRGADRGELLQRSRSIAHMVSPAFDLHRTLDGFRYKTGLDLTGYEDGTENPKGDDAVATAIVDGQGPGLDGSSFVAVQQWVHELDRFDAMPREQQDNAIGRRRDDNEELDDAPPSAHVKRTAQESFDPEAFVLRRSMPWAEGAHAGLVFVAFGRSFDAFEAQLNRMVGAEDGIIDALFTFTRPVTGGYFWCPSMSGGRLDLSALGI